VDYRANQLRNAGLCDAAHLMSDMIKRPDETHQLLDYSTQVILKHLKLYASLGVQGFVICDPSASGNLLSPRHWEQFVAPYTTAVIQAVHEIGVPSILHICGNTTKILPIVADIAPTAFSFDHAVDAGVARQAIGASVCLLGNLDPADTLLSTRNRVRDEAEKCVDTCWAGGGYVLGALMRPERGDSGREHQDHDRSRPPGQAPIHR